MKLSELVKGLNIIETAGSAGCMDSVITGVCRDHRECGPGSLFVCIEGYKTDGHRFIGGAVENGATALIVQKDIEDLPGGQLAGEKGITVIRTDNTRLALARVSDNLYGHPSQQLKLIGVTGTKGKTTVAYMIRAIAGAAGVKNGIIGTVETLIGDEKFHSQVTTPESNDLQKILSYMVEKNVELAAMEVSSQGLALDRVSCCDFDTGIFTNLYNDHISPNEHKDMEDYFKSKLRLFSMCRTGLVNADSKDAQRVLGSVEGANCEMITYGIENQADIKAKNIVNHAINGDLSVSFDLEAPWFSGCHDNRVAVGLPGKYNVYNALAAIGACALAGVSLDDIKKGLRDVKVRGRVEMVKAGQNFSVIVDYAHNAASLENLLMMLSEFRTGRIITVFGCGGDRAKDRRFDMGEVSGKLSDLTVITSDNPRTEDPGLIMENIEEGIRRTDGKYKKIADRKEAISFVLREASEGDIVVIAGKGHETYQIFSDRTIHFDDVEAAYNILRGMGL